MENIDYIKYISDPTPIELYKLNNTSCVFGFMTTALAKVQEANKNIKVFSIVNLLPEIIKKEYAKPILNFHKNMKSKKSKIFYPKKINEVKKLALKISKK